MGEDEENSAASTSFLVVGIMQAIRGQQLSSGPKTPNSPLLITPYTKNQKVSVHIT